MRPPSQLLVPAVMSADVAVLIGARHAVVRTITGLRHPHRWVAEQGADAAAGALGSAVLWCLAAWIALGVGALVMQELSARAQRTPSRLTTWLLPQAAVRLAATLTGLGIAAAPLAASATPPPAPAPALGCDTSCVASLPALSSPASPRLPSLGLAPALAFGSHTYVVRPGDSLWQIAAGRLPPDARPRQISAAATRWWSANRAVVGPDPDLLHPGQVLSAPPPPEAP